MAGFQEFWDKWKTWIIAALTLVAVIVAVIVLYFVVFKKKKEGFYYEDVVEGYMGVDDKSYADQFKYADTYINSVLGQETAYTKLAPTVVATPQPAAPVKK